MPPGVFSRGAGLPMTLAMPEIQQDGLDVSAEEERYLRRVFRRFLLPYLVVIFAAVGFTAWTSSVAPPSVDSTAAEIETLVAEAASLREALTTVRNELRELSGQSAVRLDALESDIEELSGDVESAIAIKPVAAPSAELKSRMDHAHQRINAIESRLTDALEGRLPEGDPLAKPKPAPQWPPASRSLP